LFRSGYITKFLSGLLLIIFALSITPKRFLHDMIAKHSDSRPGKNNDSPYQLANSGYHCDCDNLVAESAFVGEQPVFSFPVFTSFASYTVKDISFSSVPGIYSTLRGPPVNS